MQDVAAEARIAVATIYRHYPTKQDLYAALVQRSAEGPFLRASAVVDPERSPVANLMAFSLEIFRFMVDRPDALRFTLRTTPASWGLGEDIESWARMRDFHAALAQQCIDDGSVVGRDGRLVARLIAATLQVYLGDWLEHPDERDRGHMTEELRAQLERAFTAAGSTAAEG